MRTQFGIVLGLLAVTAAAEPLNLRPGLWEVTYTITSPREVPTAVLESLPEEQRLAMQQAWTERAGEARTETEMSCLTLDDIAGGFALQGEVGADCDQTVAEESSTHRQGTRRCTLEGAVTVVAIDMKAESPTRVSGSIVSNAEGDSVAQATHVTYEGRWRDKNCGDVE